MPITVEDIKKLPPKIQALILVGVVLLLGYFYYFFFLQATLEKRGQLQTKLAELEQQVAEKERVAAQLTKYMREVETLEQQFKIALSKLPDKKEIPALLNSVALAGKGAGVRFLLFAPKPPARPVEKPGVKDNLKPSDKRAEEKGAAGSAGAPSAKAGGEAFYDEIPVDVQIVGGYHNIALFFERVARLPRIVNIEDVVMGDAAAAADTKGRGRPLKTSCIIKTYMFVERPDAAVKKTDQKAK
jgi:type IV pilus assembly protein PilO